MQPPAAHTPPAPPASRTTLSVRHYGAAPGGHAHDHFQVLWTLDGVLELEVDGRGLALPAGQGLVLTPGQRHDFESRQGSRCLVLDTPDAAWHHRPTHAARTDALYHLTHYLATALAQGLPLTPELGAALLAQTWGQAAAPRRFQRTVDWTALSAWVAQRLDQPLTAADLAARAYLSESQFRARCLAEMGCTPMVWVRQMRLQRARLLRQQGLPLAQVARQTGYASASALSAALNALRASTSA